MMTRVSSLGSNSPQQANRPTDLRDLDLDQFLQLLIAELQNQDPLNPMENSEILQQISQIREIGATNLLSDTLQTVLDGQNLATASSMIGKEIAAVTDSGESIQGVVQRVSVEVDSDHDDQRSLRVHVGDHSIRLNNIREIVGGEGADSSS